MLFKKTPKWIGILLIVVLTACQTPQVPINNDSMRQVNVDETNAENFDFLYGEWKVLNKRLNGRLVGSTDWNQFEARFFGYTKFLGGNLNIENFEAEIEGGHFLGSSIRTFNPNKKEWVIYWVDSQNFEVFPQVRGTFKDGLGTFYGEDILNDKPVKLRFLWKDITIDQAVWEQAYYDESNNEWETNWIMEFTRVSE